MAEHAFILMPSTWIGEGKIRLSMVEEELGFTTRWKVSQSDETGRIECIQEIQIKGLSDTVHNQFSFFNLNGNNFLLELENQALGKIQGTGVLNDKVIAWEFRIPDVGFEGLEFYEKQEDGHYILRAEYCTGDQFRTLIQGKVWQQK